MTERLGIAHMPALAAEDETAPGAALMAEGVAMAAAAVQTVVQSFGETAVEVAWQPGGVTRDETQTWAEWAGCCSGGSVAVVSGIP